MPDKRLHIVSFDIPYPPNYGGVIDVFNKIRLLSGKGVGITLHCFEYPGRDRASELSRYCDEVHYYPRLTGLRSAISLKPYIVTSRRSEELMANLLSDDAPILFEGLHSCYYLADERLRDRLRIYRESNIEHRYYYSLFKADRKLLNKAYFLLASMKLRFYQRVLKHAGLMLAVSRNDAHYLAGRFPHNRVEYLPSFHPNGQPDIMTGRGEYALYHGNIEVPENSRAVEYLVTKIFNDLPYPFVIAGMKPPPRIRQLLKKYPRMTLVSDPDEASLLNLIRNAQMHVLVTFQSTGLKLKLLNTLFNGRFCLVNRRMLDGTDLDSLCEVADDSRSLKEKITQLFEKTFDDGEVNRRKEILGRDYSNEDNADRLIRLVFEG
jgi:hypothetical protein